MTPTVAAAEYEVQHLRWRRNEALSPFADVGGMARAIKLNDQLNQARHRLEMARAAEGNGRR